MSCPLCRWGWKAQALPASGSLQVTQVPCILGVTLTVADLKARFTTPPLSCCRALHRNLTVLSRSAPTISHKASRRATVPNLQVYLHCLEEAAGAAPLPPAASRILNSKACRTAIMFGGC